MNMQQMMMQAQKMQRELAKAQNELIEKEFSLNEGGIITVKMLGSHKIISINIDEEAFEPDNREVVQDLLGIAINKLIDTIEKEKGDINERITGRRTGLGF